ncbi:hypothetical protein BT93_L1650 [Corymbia citriodora subsp. variegata]|uniref:Protein kinase domain-containing protein n=1 Tax=Corymbia citriodora subsp. variegata TaxID=360336 RepID=A0A8T0CWF4_CORYI|nr:hypothetical protein BT93_L1650 [Corymbia citriodora subsp. variegata]
MSSSGLPCLSESFFMLILLHLLLPSFCSASVLINMTQFYPNDPDIIYEGDAYASSGAIHLTSVNIPYRVGRATWAKPVQLQDLKGQVADFTAHFSLTINNAQNQNSCGGGIAFFLAPFGFPIPPNSAGGFLGLFNNTGTTKNQIVMFEFDTFPNEWDPKMQHVGINNRSISSATSLAWNATFYMGKPADVQIIYNATTKNLSASWTYEQKPPVPMPTSLSYTIDLTEILPEFVTIGFSAATSNCSEQHIINSWAFTSTSNRNQGEGNKTPSFNKVLIAVIVVSFFLLVLLAGVAWWIVKTRFKKSDRDDRRRVYAGLAINMDIERGALPRKFSYQELRAATNRFASDRRLGHGGSGHVYKGTLGNQGRVIAVKRIFAQYENSEKLFINEVKIISRLVHRNLVKFIGWCHEQGEFLLVYEYMPNGSLDMHLFGNGRMLQWEVRYKIALGLASALHYLHEDAGQCVLHRDIKSANILLDTDFSTKLGDFGVAKLVDPLLRTQNTGVVGTLGYLAPEYLNEGRASRESDMFSFGVVALEIACGRRSYEFEEFQVPLIRWVWQLHLAGDLLSVADERLEGMFDDKEMECLLVVGLWCTHPDKRERPKAGEVIKVLQKEAPLPELPTNMHELEFYALALSAV